MSESRRVMFVGEDQELWPELLKCAAKENWRMTFAHAGDEALVAMDEQEFDAVVSNLKLRGMSGADLLQEVRQRKPDVWRFLRCEPRSAHEARGWAGAAHQFIPTRDAAAIETRLAQAFRKEVWMPGPVAENLLITCPFLPSPPKVYYRILETMAAPNASLEKIGELLEQDPAMSAKLLKLVNSAVFALQLEVSRPGDAVMYLGMETTKAMILMAHTTSTFQAMERSEFPMEHVMAHSFMTARYARWIAQHECPRGLTPDQAFTGGLLHDIGKFLLAGNRAEAYARAIEYARRGKMSLRQAEIDFFGADHAELGGCLLAAWGLPQPIVEAVALHHKPVWMSDSGFTPATAVHVANVFAHETNAPAPGLLPTQISAEYLHAGGFADSIESWRNHSRFRD